MGRRSKRFAEIFLLSRALLGYWSCRSQEWCWISMQPMPRAFSLLVTDCNAGLKMPAHEKIVLCRTSKKLAFTRSLHRGQSLLIESLGYCSVTHGQVRHNPGIDTLAPTQHEHTGNLGLCSYSPISCVCVWQTVITRPVQDTRTPMSLDDERGIGSLTGPLILSFTPTVPNPSLLSGSSWRMCRFKCT